MNTRHKTKPRKAPRPAGRIDQLRDQQAFHPSGSPLHGTSTTKDGTRQTPNATGSRGTYTAERSNPVHGGRHR